MRNALRWSVSAHQFNTQRPDTIRIRKKLFDFPELIHTLHPYFWNWILLLPSNGWNWICPMLSRLRTSSHGRSSKPHVVSVRQLTNGFDLFEKECASKDAK